MGDVAIGAVGVDARFGREPEDSLAHDVALDLVGPATDRDRRRHEEERLPLAVADDGLGAEERRARRRRSTSAARSLRSLAPEPSGPGTPARADRAPAASSGARPRLARARRPRRSLRVASSGPRSRASSRSRSAGPDIPVLTAPTAPRSFASAVRATDQPAPTSAMRSPSGTTTSVEEDLVEVRIAVHLPQGPHVDTGSGTCRPRTR